MPHFVSVAEWVLPAYLRNVNYKDLILMYYKSRVGLYLLGFLDYPILIDRALV